MFCLPMLSVVEQQYPVEKLEPEHSQFEVIAVLRLHIEAGWVDIIGEDVGLWIGEGVGDGVCVG